MPGVGNSVFAIGKETKNRKEIMTEIVRRKKRKRMKNRSFRKLSKQGKNDRGHGKFVEKEKLMSSLNRIRN
jgi:hypothetical protein